MQLHSTLHIVVMDQEIPLFVVLYFLFYVLVYQTTHYFFPQPLHFLEFFLSHNVQNIITPILLLNPPLLMVLCAYHFEVSLQKAVRFLISGESRFIFDCISTGFQVGRYMFYEDDLSVVVFISNLFSIFILFLYQFIDDIYRTRGKMMVKKIVKRSIYGFLVLLHLRRMFETAYLPFPLPGCIFPLIPAIMGASLIVTLYISLT